MSRPWGKREAIGLAVVGVIIAWIGWRGLGAGEPEIARSARSAERLGGQRGAHSGRDEAETLASGLPCVVIRSAVDSPSAVPVEVRGPAGDFTQDLVVGQPTCLDTDLPAVVQVLDHATDPAQATLTAPGLVELRLVEACDVRLALETFDGGPFQGDAVVYADDLRFVHGPGPHAVRASCGSVLSVVDQARRQTARGRVTQGPLVLRLPGPDVLCTVLTVVDEDGAPVEGLESRWPVTGPGRVEICSSQEHRTVVLSAPGFATTRVVVDQALPAETVMLEKGELREVLCSRDGEALPCPVASFQCPVEGRGEPLQGPRADCSTLAPDRWTCTCAVGSDLGARLDAETGWADCIAQSDTVWRCEAPLDDATLTLVGPLAPAVKGWAWVPDQGPAVGEVGSHLLMGLRPGPGTWIAMAADGWASGRLVLAPGDDARVTAELQPWSSQPVACSEALTVAWWVGSTMVGFVPVPPGGSIPVPDLPLPLAATVSCADGDDERFVLGG